ncbi:cytochrome P450 [Aerophototrophica crusticola]|uniref:Cytochrome P450 n=1 Tax=Aerophototrophica crusticola TaxID=1709002 RepID=A0A858R543_9PROT|nr:cytochrome P450 [Rhodospirillaceae bacterium B3]
MTAIDTSPTDAAAQPWVPPAPTPVQRGGSWWKTIRAVGQDMLGAWSAESYSQPIRQWRMLGGTNILVSDPALIRHVLVENEANYRKSIILRRLLGPGLGEGLLLSEGATWQRQRRTLAPAFTPRAVSGFLPAFAAGVEDMLAGWEGKREVDGLAAFQHLALDLAARTMFSARLGPGLEEFARLVMEYQHSVGRPGLLDLLAAAGMPWLPDPSRAGFKRRWRVMVDGFIAERRNRPDDPTRPRDVLDLLLAARDPDTGKGLDAAEVRDQVSTMIAAGFETTAMALYWTFYLLGCVPEAQDRVRAEAAGLPHMPDASALERLPYTRAVLQESMRLYPPAHTFSRMAAGPDRLGGVPVAPGQIVFVSPWVLHRHRSLWDQPDQFRPERFLPGSPEAGRPFTWLPFGGGPRICIGMAFAMSEMLLAVSCILRRYRVTVPNPAGVRPVGKVTTIPVGDTRLTLEPVGRG